MRSSLDNIITSRTTRTDSDVPHLYYIYGKNSEGRIITETKMYTRRQAGDRARELARANNVNDSAFQHKRAK